jgi:hypothetical protein
MKLYYNVILFIFRLIFILFSLGFIFNLIFALNYQIKYFYHYFIYFCFDNYYMILKSIIENQNFHNFIDYFPFLMSLFINPILFFILYFSPFVYHLY